MGVEEIKTSPEAIMAAQYRGEVARIRGENSLVDWPRWDESGYQDGAEVSASSRRPLQGGCLR